MEEVDTLIISAVKNLGCEFEATRLKELSSEDVFESLARCILQIKPDAGLRSVRLPPNMGSRFRTGTEMANIIKQLGYKEDVGYQTILYGSEAEVRRLLIFLIEKLPKELETSTSVQKTNLFDRLNENASQILHRQLEAPWVPWFCRRLNYKWDGKYWSPSFSPLDSTSFLSSPFDISSAVSLPAQLPQCSHLSASVVAHNSLLRQNLIETLRSIPKEKPKLPPKPKPRTKVFAEVKQELDSNNEEPKQEHAEPEPDKETVLIELIKSEVEALEFESSQLQDRILKYEDALSQLTNESQTSANRRVQMEEEMKSRKRFADLLPAASDNIQKLKEHLANTEIRMDNLVTTWENHRTSLQEQLHNLRQKRGEKTEFQRLQEESSQMRQKMETFKDELSQKQKYVQHLKSELEKTEKNISRTFYTKRILDIVENVRKQKEEIDRVLIEVKSVQKDINMLTGKLDRTFTATDELMFNDAKKDDLIRRAYKIVVSLHESCGEIVSNVESVGHFLREVRDFEDKIELETQNGVDNKLEQLVNNYCEIKQENETIMIQLKKLTGTSFDED